MTHRPRLTVIGTGYLGATHAVCMAELGFEVVGLDVLPAKVEALASGTVPFFEPGLPELLRKNLDTGRLRFTTSFQEAGEFGDVHFICVGTPQKKGEYAADMTYVDAAFTALLPHVRAGSLLVGKSTVPAGTAERLAEQIAATRPDVELAWNPEFLREGFAIRDTLTPDRLVFGVRSARAEAQLRAAFAPVIEDSPAGPAVPVVVTDFATAQLVKVAANAFLATKISFINAMAEVCEATGGDVTQLSKALSYDTRIGGRFLHAGLGFGGGCLPKDIRAFMARAGELGVASEQRCERGVGDRELLAPEEAQRDALARVAQQQARLDHHRQRGLHVGRPEPVHGLSVAAARAVRLRGDRVEVPGEDHERACGGAAARHHAGVAGIADVQATVAQDLEHVRGEDGLLAGLARDVDELERPRRQALGELCVIGHGEHSDDPSEAVRFDGVAFDPRALLRHRRLRPAGPPAARDPSRAPRGRRDRARGLLLRTGRRRRGRAHRPRVRP